MDTLFKSERHKRIQTIINKNGHATVAELSSLFDVSAATIRRDLEEMDQQGLIQREHGGAARADRAASEPPVLLRVDEQAAEKQRIARAALELVHSGETIFLGSGTTTFQIAKALAERARPLKNLTVITNALNIAGELVNLSDVTLIVIGGVVRHSEMSMVGPVAEQALRELRADKVFMGIRAINLHDGLTNDNLMEIQTDRAILELASHVILVADHTKFGKVSTSRVGPVEIVDRLITDDQVPITMLRELESRGIEVIIA
jgi:DeoR/GlpR family transcriptional regulator of sugar metabolism